MSNQKYFRKIDVIYTGKIRAGAYPKITTRSYKVIKCRKSGLVKLNKFPKLSYESKQYRNLYNNGLKVKTFRKFSNVDQNPRFFGLKKSLFEGKTVLDYGCGYGFFLDNIKKISKKTLAIEPQKDLQRYLESKGHKNIFKKDFKNYEEKIDIITSFGVIEHTKNPEKYLQLAYKLLKKGGTLYLCTDNLNDILMHLNLEEFKQFYFRTAHFWYFNKNNLEPLLKKNGFKKVNLEFLHNHGYNNFIHWLENKKPLNDNKLNKTKLDIRWQKILSKTGRSELLFATCKK